METLLLLFYCILPASLLFSLHSSSLFTVRPKMRGLGYWVTGSEITHLHPLASLHKEVTDRTRTLSLSLSLSLFLSHSQQSETEQAKCEGNWTELAIHWKIVALEKTETHLSLLASNFSLWQVSLSLTQLWGLDEAILNLTYKRTDDRLNSRKVPLKQHRSTLVLTAFLNSLIFLHLDLLMMCKSTTRSHVAHN